MSGVPQGPVAFVFLILILDLNWAFWLGGWLRDLGQMCISNGYLSGGTAWFYANLNLWFWLAQILGISAYLYFGGGSKQ